MVHTSLTHIRHIKTGSCIYCKKACSKLISSLAAHYVTVIVDYVICMDFHYLLVARLLWVKMQGSCALPFSQWTLTHQGKKSPPYNYSLNHCPYLLALMQGHMC